MWQDVAEPREITGLHYFCPSPLSMPAVACPEKGLSFGQIGAVTVVAAVAVSLLADL